MLVTASHMETDWIRILPMALGLTQKQIHQVQRGHPVRLRLGVQYRGQDTDILVVRWVYCVCDSGRRDRCTAPVDREICSKRPASRRKISSGANPKSPTSREY
jgi:hypothetical protein